MSEEKKTAALDESTLDAVTGGGWSPPPYIDCRPQTEKDAADQVNGQFTADSNKKQQP